MDREIIDFDPAYFGMSTAGWQIDVRGKGGDAGVTGAGQVVYGNQPRWTASLEMTTLLRSRILAWRATVARLRGRVNVLRVRVADPLRPLNRDLGLSAADLLTLSGGLPHEDGSDFSDETGYGQAPVVHILAAAAAGKTALSFDGEEVAGSFQGGQMFSIDDWLYQAVSVEDAGGSAVVTFEPPLRRSVSSGDEIHLDATTLMAVQGDLEGTLKMEVGIVASPSLSLVEWVGPGR